MSHTGLSSLRDSPLPSELASFQRRYNDDDDDSDDPSRQTTPLPSASVASSSIQTSVMSSQVHTTVTSTSHTPAPTNLQQLNRPPDWTIEDSLHSRASSIANSPFIPPQLSSALPTQQNLSRPTSSRTNSSRSNAAMAAAGAAAISAPAAASSSSISATSNPPLTSSSFTPVPPLVGLAAVEATLQRHRDMRQQQHQDDEVDSGTPTSRGSSVTGSPRSVEQSPRRSEMSTPSQQYSMRNSDAPPSPFEMELSPHPATDDRPSTFTARAVADLNEANAAEDDRKHSLQIPLKKGHRGARRWETNASLALSEESFGQQSPTASPDNSPSVPPLNQSWQQIAMVDGELRSSNGGQANNSNSSPMPSLSLPMLLNSSSASSSGNQQLALVVPNVTEKLLQLLLAKEEEIYSQSRAIREMTLHNTQHSHSMIGLIQQIERSKGEYNRLLTEATSSANSHALVHVPESTSLQERGTNTSSAVPSSSPSTSASTAGSPRPIRRQPFLVQDTNEIRTQQEVTKYLKNLHSTNEGGSAMQSIPQSQSVSRGRSSVASPHFDADLTPRPQLDAPTQYQPQQQSLSHRSGRSSQQQSARESAVSSPKHVRLQDDAITSTAASSNFGYNPSRIQSARQTFSSDAALAQYLSKVKFKPSLTYASASMPTSPPPRSPPLTSEEVKEGVKEVEVSPPSTRESPRKTNEPAATELPLTDRSSVNGPVIWDEEEELSDTESQRLQQQPKENEKQQASSGVSAVASPEPLVTISSGSNTGTNTGNNTARSHVSSSSRRDKSSTASPIQPQRRNVDHSSSTASFHTTKHTTTTTTNVAIPPLSFVHQRVEAPHIVSQSQSRRQTQPPSPQSSASSARMKELFQEDEEDLKIHPSPPQAQPHSQPQPVRSQQPTPRKDISEQKQAANLTPQQPPSQPLQPSSQPQQPQLSGSDIALLLQELHQSRANADHYKSLVVRLKSDRVKLKSKIDVLKQRLEEQKHQHSQQLQQQPQQPHPPQSASPAPSQTPQNETIARLVNDVEDLRRKYKAEAKQRKALEAEVKRLSSQSATSTNSLSQQPSREEQLRQEEFEYKQRLTEEYLRQLESQAEATRRWEMDHRQQPHPLVSYPRSDVATIDTSVQSSSASGDRGRRRSRSPLIHILPNASINDVPSRHTETSSLSPSHAKSHYRVEHNVAKNQQPRSQSLKSHAASHRSHSAAAPLSRSRINQYLLRSPGQLEREQAEKMEAYHQREMERRQKLQEKIAREHDAMTRMKTKEKERPNKREHRRGRLHKQQPLPHDSLYRDLPSAYFEDEKYSTRSIPYSFIDPYYPPPPAPSNHWRLGDEVAWQEERAVASRHEAEARHHAPRNLSRGVLQEQFAVPRSGSGIVPSPTRTTHRFIREERREEERQRLFGR